MDGSGAVILGAHEAERPRVARFEFADPELARMAAVADELRATMDMPYELFEPVMYNMSVSGAAYNTSTTITDISANPQYVMFPNKVTTVGQTLRFRAGGVFSTTGTPNLTLGIYKNTQTTSGATGVGGSALAATTTTATASGASNLIWMIDLECVFQAVGTSGSVFSYGFVLLGTTASAATPIPIPFTTPQTATSFDTTKATLLTVGATWGTSSASNTITCNQLRISLAN